MKQSCVFRQTVLFGKDKLGGGGCQRIFHLISNSILFVGFVCYGFFLNYLVSLQGVFVDIYTTFFIQDLYSVSACLYRQIACVTLSWG